MSSLDECYRWIVKFCLVGLLVVSGNVSEAMAKDYFVAVSNGNDGNSGTIQAPFKTLERGFGVLLPGDTLYVRGGTYLGFLPMLKIPSGNSWDQPVIVKAYQQEKVVLTSPWGKTALPFKSGSQYIIVDGFTIDAKNGDGGITTGSNSHHIRIMNGEVMNSTKSGVTTHASSYAFEFINLRIHDTKAYGLYLASSSHLVKDCSIYRNSGWGIHVYSGSAEKPSNNRIVNNKVYNNATSGNGVGIGIYSGTGNSVINNIVWGHNRTGIEINWGAHDSKVYHNTIYKERYGIYVDRNSGTNVINNIISSSVYYGVVISSYGKNIQIKNNLVYGSGTGKNIVNRGAATILSKNLEGNNYNPQFVNPGSFDFHLQSGSPAIDVGLDLSEVNNDFDYNARPKRSSHDIGSYEKS